MCEYKRFFKLLLLILLISPCHSEVILDGTVGNAVPGFNIPISSSGKYIISPEVGQQVGQNLLHSFDEFNVEDNETVVFNDEGAADGIENIIARVTGENKSTINGVLNSDFKFGKADLYLVNPQGIVFGGNASINVQGSFYARNASYIKFSDGIVLNNSNSPSSIKFTSASPELFGFLENLTGKVDVNGGEFRVGKNETIAFIGNKVVFKSGMIDSPNSIVELVNVEPDNEFNVPNLSNKYQVSQNSGELDVGEVSDGDVLVKAVSLNLRNGARIGRSGRTVVIDVEDLNLFNGGRIGSYTTFSGSAGDITINASGKVEISGDNKGVLSEIRADVVLNKEADSAGSIAINTPKLTIDGGRISSSAFAGNGVSGEIDIHADQFRILNGGVVETINAAGKEKAKKGSGKINVIASDFVKIQGHNDAGPSNMNSAARNETGAGTVLIVTPSFELDGGRISTTVEGTGGGEPGLIRIQAGEMVIKGSGGVFSETSGSSSGGNIQLESEKIFISDKSAIAVESNYSSGNKGTAGDAGTIRIETGEGIFSLKADSRVSANTSTTGHGGSIHINTGSLEMDAGSAISASSEYEPGKTSQDYKLGDAGAVVIQANSIDIDGAEVSVSSLGADGGDVIVNTGSGLIVDNGGAIKTSVSGGDGNGGNVLINQNTVKTGQTILLLNNGSTITARAEGLASLGDGGNILINERTDRNAIALSDSSEIRAGTSAQAGKGGKIVLKGQAFFSRDILDSQVTATAPDKKNVGEVATFEPEFDVKTATILLPSGLFDTSSISETRCVNRDSNVSNFYISERQGIASMPDSLMAGYSDSAIAVQHDDQSGNSSGRMEDSLNVDVAIAPAGFCVN